MRILFVIKSVAIPGGGAERVLSELTRQLTLRGHQVSVASFDSPDSKPFYDYGEGVPLIRLGIGNVSNRSGPLKMARRVFALRRLTLAHRPDVAIGFMHSAYVPLAAALAGTSIPVLASEHIV